MTTTNDHLAKREEIFSAPSGHRSLIRAVDCTVRGDIDHNRSVRNGLLL